MPECPVAKADFFGTDEKKTQTNQFFSSASSCQSVAMDIQCGYMLRDQSDDIVARANQRHGFQSHFLYPEVLLSHLGHIHFSHMLDGNTYDRLFFRLRNGSESDRNQRSD